MSRPRTLTDEVILDRLGAFLASRDGVSPWTLAEAGRQVGLTPAGLLKRFGSRQGMLVALSTRWIEQIPTGPSGGDPLVELTGWVTAKGAGGRPLIGRLTDLVADLADPVLTGLLVKGWAREREYVAELLGELDLPGLPDPAVGAAVLLDCLTGAGLRAGTGDEDHSDPQQILTTFLEVWA